VTFLVDNQLPTALARLIQHEFREQAEHVADLGLRDASDAALWKYASAEDLILISKDEDFVTMVLQSPTAGLLWVRIGNCRREFLLGAFRRAWPRIMQKLHGGERFIEIR
jgi:predicted nuclease of predicted toxin-antitoxin system